MKPRILILITKADIGGAQIHVLELIRGLMDQYEFILAVGEEDYLARKAREEGIKVTVLDHLVRPLSLKQDILGFKEIRQLLKQTQPALLHAHSSKAGVLGRLAALSVGVPALFTAHGWAYTEGAHPLRRLYGWGIEFCLSFISRGIVTISDYDTRLAHRLGVGLGRAKWLVKNCVAQSKWVSGKGSTTIEHDLPIIISIGRLSPVKNQVLLVEALALLYQPFRAWIVGEGDQRKVIENKCRELDLEDQVSLLGEVEDCDSLLAQADLFVLSSNYEGLPLSVLEAMSASLPVVATDVGGVSEAVVDGKTGCLVPRMSPHELAEKIDSLLGDEEVRQQMGRAGSQLYQQQFTLDKLISGMRHVYDDIL